MNAVLQSPERSAAASSQAGGDELEYLIFQAERAVIERDERLRLRTHRLGEQLRTKAGTGARVALGVAAGIGVAALAWKLLAHRRPVRTRRALRMRRKAVASKPPGVPWHQWLSIVAPLLPPGIRPRGQTTVTSLLVAAALPLLKRRLDHRGSTTHQPPLPAAEVDLQRFAGDWYEVARLPFHEDGVCAGDITTSYVLDGSGSLRIVNRCKRSDGGIDTAEGVARVTDPVSGSKLEVSYAPSALKWVPWAWSEYWILHVDADYRIALVGTPDRRHLWLLARHPQLSQMEYQRLLNQVRNQGYDPAKLKRTPQPQPQPPTAL